VNAIARPMTAGSALTTDDWCTPKWLCDLLGRFDLDPCSNARSHVDAYGVCDLTGEHRNTLERDGLEYDWRRVREREPVSVFVNPPYSNVMPWAVKLAEHNGPWCALLKLDPTTKWWATLMTASPQVAPFRKRIKFEGSPSMTANFPSALVYRAWAPSRELEQHMWIARYV
jgi:hypothetical protein